jgi:hypothetical protein
MKANDKELELHSLIQISDDIALAKLYDLYGESIVKSLKRWFQKVASIDEALIFEAVNEAFFGYYRNPGTFDPNQNSLHRFLEIAADRDLKNILQREKKHSNKQSLPEDVELEDKFWNNIRKDRQSTDEELIWNQSLELVDKELANYFTNEVDISLAKMVLSEKRETEAFSKVLQIQNLSIAEQRKEVKRNKDRVKKVLERNQVPLKLKSLLQ